jgi:hypothetical protein
LTPLILKNQIINLIYSLAGESRITSTLSYVGILEVPDEMAKHIERFDVMLGAPRLNKINSTACTYGDILNISFSSTIKETDVERTFFTFLITSGLHVKIESNRRV